MAPAIARRRAGLLLALALGLAARAHALEPDRALTQYVRQDWRAPHALPHDNVTAILQTGDGYLWVGTVEGLARFDGVRSVVFDKSTTPALGDNWIRALVEDRAGRLWIATYGGGLACLEQGRFHRYGEAEGLPGDVLLTLHEDRGGRVWVGAHDGLYRLVGERFVRETSAGAPRTAVHAILDDRSGTLWIGTVDGLYRRGAEGWQRQAGLNNEVVLALAETDEGLWIGTENGGLNHFGDGRMSALTPAEGLAHPRVWALAADRTGSLWIGTDGGGLQRLHRRRLETLSTANGLPSDSVWALAEDREGGFWVGTSGGGLLRLGAGPVLPWTTREGLPTDFVWGVLRTRSGELYAGTEGKGLLRLGGERVESFPVHEPGPGTAKVLLERRDGSLWIGRHHGLAVWRDGRVVGVPAGALDDDTINDLAEDPDGTLWIASNSSGLWALDAGGARRVEDFPGLGTDSVNALLVARDGALWAATLDGVLRRRGDEIDVWTRNHGLPSSYVTDLVEGPDGAVWAATRGGLVRIRYGRVDVPGARQGFDDAVTSLLLDRSGFLWLGGNRGLLRVEVRQLEE
ncbi:MAG TPA: two-component regulator propeller domain-containing protein, partial [Thermoanaerobaculia bacterium]|nr:two-component regulator propeller domain-containing protein [Thermoanaerobaculia bacterium]